MHCCGGWRANRGFILTEENPPLAHIITLDVAEAHRRHGVGTALLAESEKNLALRGVRSILLETAIDNDGCGCVLEEARLSYRSSFEALLSGPAGRLRNAKNFARHWQTGSPAQKET